MSHAARWWEPLPDGRIACRLCPRHCKLHAGQRGFCFVRVREGDHLVLATYGRSSGFCVDPIEKKPLHHFLPGSAVLSFGTAGCNLGCRFCQNWDISKAQALDCLAESGEPHEIAASALRHGCASVAFTYNDPVIFAEYAIDVARACHEVGIRTVAVTAGYISPEAWTPFFSPMDAANVDLKSFSDAFYRRMCFARLQPVLDTLVYLHRETSVWLEVTTLIIPGENDTDDELDRMSDWFVDNLGPDVPWHFTAFHPDFKLSAPPTPLGALQRARQIARAKGVRYVYIGNLHDPAGACTWCPSCGGRLIERTGYRIRDYGLEGDCCAQCGTRIPGVFNAARGAWTGGRSRVAVRRAGDYNQ